MFLNKANTPQKNTYFKMEISSDCTEIGKIISLFDPLLLGQIETFKYLNIYILQ